MFKTERFRLLQVVAEALSVSLQQTTSIKVSDFDHNEAAKIADHVRLEFEMRSPAPGKLRP
jgi:hypothetical protein